MKIESQIFNAYPNKLYHSPYNLITFPLLNLVSTLVIGSLKIYPAMRYIMDSLLYLFSTTGRFVLAIGPLALYY